MDNSQSMDLAVLSSEAMKNTERAFWQYGLGGLAGAYGAGYLAGGASGVLSPVNGIRVGVRAFGQSFVGGAVTGYGSYSNWW